MLPEFLGTAVGTTIIRMRLATPWTRALAAMAFAMAISIVVNMLIISLSLA
jgi:hypothetical protein